MQEPGAGAQHTDGTGRRERLYWFVAIGIVVAAILGVGAVENNLLGPLLLLHQSPQRQLAYGGATCALAVIGSLLPLAVLKRRAGLLRSLLVTLVLCLVVFPFLSGSFHIANALNQLSGWGADDSGIVRLAFLLWAILFSVLIAVYAHLGFVVYHPRPAHERGPDQSPPAP